MGGFVARSRFLRGGARAALAILTVASMLSGAQAVQPDEQLPDAALEARARAISAELRCLVCQNQSIDDSDAPLARDLRLLVRERLKAGDSDAAAQAFIVERYGEFVLLKPRLNVHTLLLWLAPPVLLLIGAGLAWRSFGRRAHEANGEGSSTAASLTDDERAKLDAVLQRDRPAQ